MCPGCHRSYRCPLEVPADSRGQLEVVRSVGHQKSKVSEVSHSQRLEDPAPRGCAAPPAARLPGCSRRPAAGGRPRTWTGPCARCAAPPPRTPRAAFPPDTPLHMRAHALGLLTGRDVINRCGYMRAGLYWAELLLHICAHACGLLTGGHKARHACTRAQVTNGQSETCDMHAHARGLLAGRDVLTTGAQPQHAIGTCARVNYGQKRVSPQDACAAY